MVLIGFEVIQLFSEGGGGGGRRDSLAPFGMNRVNP